jgi:hypothetical protein
VGLDLHIHLDRDEDDRLNGTVRVLDAGEVRSFSGTLELLRVFEDLLSTDAASAVTDRSSGPRGTAPSAPGRTT